MQAIAEIAERISTISVSSTLKVSADADRLRREGADVVDFGAGEPDFPTPQNIKQAAIDAISSNFTKYTNAGGTPELRAAICERHKQDFGTNYTSAECMVTVGGKHAIFNLIQALINPRDEESLNQVENRSEEHTSELQSQSNLVCRLLLEKKKALLVS